MKCLVAGGAGFLGSHLCDALLAQGHDVLCIDDLSTGSARNLRHLSGNRSFTFTRADVRERIDVVVDRIFNFACPASPLAYQRDPVRTLSTSVNGALNLLELAERCGATILQASTSEVYGDPDVHPQSERYQGNVNPIGIRACYDEGKRAAEALFFDFHRTRSVPIKVARIFNTYGPRMQVEDGRAVSNLVVQALRGEPMTIFGDGAQTRSFCYVDDLVSGVLALADTPTGVSGPFNLGNPQEITLQQLATEVHALVGGPSPIVFRPRPADDPKRRCPDISAARAVLNWSPRTALREGLIETIGYFRSTLLEMSTL
ncbi:UDP-glucuronic acid decarboxylase family protein [Sphingomonas pituitosa]|uniref:UDP-glucuronic acid decarboxylase family protein n=1 Tax=Sphingomonas pituitosa TaxID=99597 RepID=UPI000837188E|nr:UDP-glucuronic acid decarboxylase family protein [Sphingomonas pituitosa]